MTTSLIPGDAPVSLNEARSWLRLGPSIDDAVVAGLVRAATSVCEAFIGQWLIVRAGEETVPLCSGGARLTARPVVAIDAVVLLSAAGEETVLNAGDYRWSIMAGGAARLAIAAAGNAERVRVTYRAGMADGVNAIPEAIRQGIVRMTQYLHDARGGAQDGAGEAPPAVIAALWQPWRVLSLGSGR